MAIPTIEARITEVRRIAPRVCEMSLAPAAPIHFAPGQWVSVHLPVGPRPPLIRAYSLALPEAPSGELVLCTDLVPGGLGSTYLHTLEAGTVMTLAGPFGNFVLPEPVPAHLFLAARFTGIVPIRCILRHLAARDWPIAAAALVYGAREPEELVYNAELAALAESVPGFTYFPLTGAADSGDSAALPETPRIREALAHVRATAGGEPFLPMISGVKEFVRPLRQLLMDEAGFERRAVRCESYD
jgi:ferredoxin-NADP reductase